MNHVVQLFANPYSGGFDRAKLRKMVSELKAQGADVLVTLDTPFVLAGPFVTEIAVMGGDGTIRDAVACLIQANVDLPIRILPAGTVNLLSRELSDRQEDGVVSYYPGLVNDQVALVCVSGGPDARIVAGASHLLKKWIGRCAYLLSAFRQMLVWREDLFTLEMNEQNVTCAAFYLAKGRFYAGPWSFAPHANGGEAQFHGVALTKGGRLNYLRFTLETLLGWTTKRDGLTRFSCRTVRITSVEAAPIQIDGDCLGVCPVTLSVKSEPLRIRLS